MESWEDVDDATWDEMLSRLSPGTAGDGHNSDHKDSQDSDGGDCGDDPSLWSPSPEEVAAGDALALGAWKFAFTFHAGRVESPTVSPDLRELLTGPRGQPLLAALLTTFYPFEPKFLMFIPHKVRLTVCVMNDRMSSPYFFGMELMKKRRHGEATLAETTFCTKCMPADMPLHCAEHERLRPCSCPAKKWRRVQWVFPALDSGYSLMHSKLMVLRFQGFLRLVVSSFNLSMEQVSKAGDTFWWVDVPFCNAEEDSCFSKAAMVAPLLDHLKVLAVPRCWSELVRKCKWSHRGEKRSGIRHG